jgi:conjugative transfer signal peptidase TraF
MTQARLGISLCGGAALLWLAVSIADRAGVRINHTSSLPVGLWRIAPLRGQLARGVIVSFCPPATAILSAARARGFLDPGRCPGSVEPMLKQIVAITGDRVSLGADGVAVNERPIPGSRRLGADGAGRPILAIPLGDDIVGESAFWALSTDHPGSFDSRYFGAAKTAGIIGVATPWIVWQ